MIMPVATRRQRSSSSSLTAVIFLITVGLVAKVCNGSGGIENPASYNEEEQHVSPSQKYFDAVAPEDRVNFIKYHLDLALEQRYADYVRQIQPDFSFVNYGDPPPDQTASTPTTPPLSQTTTTTPKSPTTLPPWSSPNLPSVVRFMFDMTDRDVYNYVKYSLVCYSSGCIDPADIGNICCPF